MYRIMVSDTGQVAQRTVGGLLERLPPDNVGSRRDSGPATP